jgi:hypothetical protein
MTKKLFILVSYGGDGSYNPQFTFNEEWIKKQEELYDEGNLEYPALGVDGDGFHYSVLTVPDECTLQSLGISYDCAK